MIRFPRLLILGTIVLSCLSGAVCAQQLRQGGSQMLRFKAEEGLAAENAGEILARKLHLNPAADELRLAYDEAAGEGMRVQRFNQYFKGIRVAHGSFSFASRNGVGAFASGKFYSIDPATPLAPALTEDVALNSALAAIRGKHYAWESVPSLAPKGVLQFVEDFRSVKRDGQVHLAYAFDIRVAEPLGRYQVFVDAATGAVLFKNAILKAYTAKAASLYSDTVTFDVSRTGSLYYLNDYTRGGGINTYNLNGGAWGSSYTSYSSNTLRFGKDAAIDAHWAAEKTYDYWKTVRSRNGWDGFNAPHTSFVHYGSGVINAFWDGSAMNFGDGGSGYGPLVSIDVCAHELGHGICQATCDLIYAQEPGAMNEGFSDIWGAVVEAWADPHERDAIAKDRWLVGEELGSPLRSMKRPKDYRQPDTYMGDNWVYAGQGCDQTNDECGVHTNSGVLNYWFYLLSDGGKDRNDNGDDFQVRGVGMSKAATIAYATELSLNSLDEYADCRDVSIAAVETLYGACSAEAEAVSRAWHAVGLGPDYLPCVPQVSFAALQNTATEDAGINACPAAHTINVPVVLQGAALSSGPAVVTATVVGGTAIRGVDYDAPSLTATFTVGGNTTQYIPITVYDNGADEDDKFIDLAYSLNAGSSNAVRAAVFDTTRVVISNDEHAPDRGGSESHAVLTYNATGDHSSPFFASASSAHSQYVYRASELKAAGLHPGAPVTALQFFVVDKQSTRAYSGFTLSMANTSAAGLGNGFISGMATVYSGAFNTVLGSDLITFSSPFNWNGTDNVVVDFCFSNSGHGALNDKVQSQAGSYYLSGLIYANGTNACSLPFDASYLVAARPVLSFVQTLAPTPVATKASDTRAWRVMAGTTNYFYSADSAQLIASIAAASDTFSCLTATVVAAGKGFRPSAAANRSRKEWTITPSSPVGSGFSYDATFFVTTDELDGTDPASIRILQTTATDDGGMTAANTVVVSPTGRFAGQGYTGFRGNFQKTGRFFLTDGEIALSAGTLAGGSGSLWTGANPFTDAPELKWNLSVPERATIRIYDVTGKLVWQAEQVLNSGTHSLKLGGGAAFLPGAYVLQVLRGNGVFVRRSMKQ